MPARHPHLHRALSLAVALTLLGGCQTLPFLQGSDAEGTVVYGNGKLMLGSRFIAIRARDGKALGELSVQVGGKIYKSKNGNLLLPEYALKEAQQHGLLVLVPGYVPRKVTFGDADEIVLVPVNPPKIHPGVGASGGTLASGDGVATVLLPPGMLKQPPTSVAVGTYTPAITAGQQAEFDKERQAFTGSLGLGTGCDQPLPCGPLARALGLLVTIDGPINPGQLPVRFDLAAVMRGWSGEGEAPPGWSEAQIEQARAAALMLKTFAAIDAAGNAAVRQALSERYGIRLEGRMLSFTLTLGDNQMIDGYTRVEVDGFQLLGVRLEVTVVSAVSGNLPGSASQPGLQPGPGGGVVAGNGGSIIASGGGNIIAAGGGNLIGQAGTNLIGEAGTNVIAAGGGNLIGPKTGIIAAGGGNLADVVDGSGTLVSNRGGAFSGELRLPTEPMAVKYGLLSYVDYAAPGAKVRLIDVLGQPLTNWVETDGNGRYEIHTVPNTPTGVFVEAISHKSRALTFAPAPGHGSVSANLDAASTLVTAYLMEALKTGNMAALNYPNFLKDVAAARTLLSQTEAEAVTAASDVTTVATMARTIFQAHNMAIQAITTPNVSTLAAGSFNWPTGLFVAPNGDVFVADRMNHRIARVKPDGTVSTFVGGASGVIDGLGAAARFNNPTGVTIDKDGNIYVADKFNHTIRKVTPAGNTTTFAGDTAGYADGVGVAALFNAPDGLVADEHNNLYVAEAAGNRIRKIAPDGTVTTLAGDGTAGFADGAGTAAQFNGPTKLVIDSQHNLFVADFSNHRIRKIDPAGNVTTFAGDGTAGFADGLGAAARFNGPMGLAIDEADYLYVVERDNHRVRMISPGGSVVTLAGTGVSGATDGIGTAAQFNGPADIAIDGNGVLYVADRQNNAIRKVGVPSTWVTPQLKPPLWKRIVNAVVGLFS